MVHALEIIHRLLKPSGFLIDIHPAAVDSSVEIHQNGKIDLVGQLKIHQWCVDFEQADEALVEIVQLGMFVVEQKSMYDTLTYYNSAAEMGKSLKESIQKYTRVDEPVEEEMQQVEVLASHVDELMSAIADGAELLLREKDHISRLKPM